MGINRRITSPEARFLRHPEKVEAWLQNYSKDNPAKVSQEMYDAIRGNPFLSKVHNRVVVQDGREPDLPVHLRKVAPAKPQSFDATQAEIDAADEYWRSRATHDGQEMFRLPGNFFWCELIEAVKRAGQS